MIQDCYTGSNTVNNCMNKGHMANELYTKSHCTIIESNGAALLSLHVVALMGLSQNCDIYSVSYGQTSAGVLWF